MKATSQKVLELLDGQSRVPNDPCHRLGVHGIVPWNLHCSNPIAHGDVLALTNQDKPSLFERVHRSKVRYAGKLRHRWLNGNLFAIYLGPKALLDFWLGFQVFSDGNFDVLQCFLFIASLAAATGQVITPNREPFLGLDQCYSVLHCYKFTWEVTPFKPRDRN